VYCSPHDRYMIRILPSKVIAISAGKSISIGNDYAAIPGYYSVVVVFTKQWEIFKSEMQIDGLPTIVTTKQWCDYAVWKIFKSEMEIDGLHRL
jgi:hypothetical protein